jgi:hypothetical protein
LSIRFQADNDLKRIIIDAALRREPGIDFQTAHTARLDNLDDEEVLRLAALQSRILVSHDKRTMPRKLASFIASGGTSPGVLLVIPQAQRALSRATAKLRNFPNRRRGRDPFRACSLRGVNP